MGLDREKMLFRTIAEQLVAENNLVTTGKMMSSPGLKYRDKVFAFYYNNTMVFKLGRNFKPETVGIAHYTLLAPFKTKPAMVDWFEITSADQHKWKELARHALRLATEQLK